MRESMGSTGISEGAGSPGVSMLLSGAVFSPQPQPNERKTQRHGISSLKILGIITSLK